MNPPAPVTKTFMSFSRVESNDATIRAFDFRKNGVSLNTNLTRNQESVMKTTTEELLAFVAVIDSGSITAAAEALQQTVSGVSRALTRLEKKLDAALVRRTTRRLQLTDEGEMFLVRARAILAAMEDAEESIARQRERPAGRLRVDAASPFVLHCIVPHMNEFAAMYPEITLELSSNERIVD